MFDISTSSMSPGFIQSGGLRLWPTPSGVPVAMTSPGCSVVKSEQKLTICRHRIDQLVGAGMLDLLAVQPRGQRELSRIGDFVGGDDPRPERTGAGPVLARGDGEFLVVAHAAVDKDGVARDVVERAVDRDMPAALADHHGQLALEVEIVRQLRPDHLPLMSNQGVGEADEHARLFRQFAAHFGGVIAIVHAGADDLVRVGDDRQEAHVGQLEIRFRDRRGGAHAFQGACRKRIAQRRVPAHGDDAVTGYHAVAFLAAGDVTRKFHIPHS